MRTASAAVIAISLVSVAAAAYARPTAAPPPCVEALEDADARAIERARRVRRSPRARVSIVSMSPRRIDPNAEAVRRHQANERALLGELGGMLAGVSECYQRVLTDDVEATGGALLTLVTRDDRSVEVSAVETSAHDPRLVACAVRGLEGARTRRAYGTDEREVALLFCPSDRAVCIAGPLSRLPGNADGRALSAAIEARVPAVIERARAARLRAATFAISITLSPRGSVSMGLGDDRPAGASPDDVLDVLEPIGDLCAPRGMWPRAMPFLVRSGVR